MAVFPGLGLVEDAPQIRGVNGGKVEEMLHHRACALGKGVWGRKRCLLTGIRPYCNPGLLEKLLQQAVFKGGVAKQIIAGLRYMDLLL